MDSNVRGTPSAVGPAVRLPRAIRRLTVVVVLILVLGLVAAAAASLAVARANVSEHRQALETQGAAITTSFEQQINQAVRVLRTAKGLLSVDPTPTSERFQTFLDSAIKTSTADDGTLLYDGLSAVTFIRWVRAADAATFIESKRRDGFGHAFGDVPTDTDSYVIALHSLP